MKETILNTNDLIEYQQDFIISRTLINQNSGSITLFAFDQKQKPSEHTTPFDALIQIVD